MFLKSDGIDKQLERMASRGSSCRSWSSMSTANSSTTGNTVKPSNAMITALIRDLSFWDATPSTSTNAFPSPFPQKPHQQTNQPYHHAAQQHLCQPQPLLKRGRAVSARDPSREYSRQHSSGSSHSNKGTIDDLNNTNYNWKPQPVWKAAMDPMTGRTYYYDAVTRRTQWEKPLEVRQMEKQKKSQRRKRDRLFFLEMEKNILKSLSRGEVVPGIPKAKLEPTGPPLEPRNANPLGARNFRTLSRMDDTILAELRDDVISPEEFDRALQAQQRTRPRSSSRGRPPLPGPSRSSRSERSRSRSRSQRQQSSADQPVESAAETSSETTAKPGNGRSRPLPRGLAKVNSQNVVAGRSKARRQCSNVTASSPGGEDPAGPDALAGERMLVGPIQAEIQTLADSNAPPAYGKNHVRRNTGGTIYMNGTMSNPDVEATIKCVCGVYRAHLVQAPEQRNKHSPVSVMGKPSLDLDVFHDQYHLSLSSSWKKHNMQQDALPSLADIVEFYQEFYRRSQMEFDTIIMSLIYVERLIKTTNITPGPENWRSVLFSCMVLASKVWDDLSMWNIDFSNVASAQSSNQAEGLSLFTLQRVNQLELVLLKSLNFDVRVPASEYAKYYFLIRTMLLRSGLLEGAAKPLGKEEAKGLENRTSQYQDSKISNQHQHDRRTKSMYDYTWLENNSQQDEGGELSRSPDGGPVLKDKVCLEQLVNMTKGG